MTNKTNSIFDNFTGKYSLSKTLRFELKPVGKTLENMRDHLRYDEHLKTFLVDQEIEDAYQIIKPQVDKLHEEFITLALESSEAKKIRYHNYFDLRRKLIEKKLEIEKERKQNVGNKTKKAEENSAINNLEDEIDKNLTDLRFAFKEVFSGAGTQWKKKYKKLKWKIGGNEASGYRVLSSPDALKLIAEKVENDITLDIEKKESIKKAATKIGSFFTYLSGFNQNRENYYETEKEAITAVATRTIHENLPRFAENLLNFKSRQSEYLSAYQYLIDLGRTLKDQKGNDLTPIKENIFMDHYFSNCLSQREIEVYNVEIGNANIVINLYNQVRNKKSGFKNLPRFKKLYKQIGCGKKDPLFFVLTHEKKSEAAEARKKNKTKKFFSVEEIIELVEKAGKEYFQKNNNEDVETIPEFIKYIKSRTDYAGFYWSRRAINTISNIYFADWRSLQTRLKEAKVFKTGKKGDEEDIKIPEAVELKPIFEVLDTTSDWKKTLFKPSLIDEKNKYNKAKIISASNTAHDALLGMILDDLQKHADEFLIGIKKVKSAMTAYFKAGKEDMEGAKKKWKEEVKRWMDHALAVNRILKYFKVRESKIKSTPMDDTISQTLDILLFGKKDEVEWFKWHNALRNFLTKKPQDDTKENKLKLNFENGSLLGGWSDGQEKIKAAVLLRRGGLYYLGILKNKSIFDTEKENNPIYKNVTPNSGRLIVANLSFKTLSGKGFKGEFNEKYSDMGKRDPQKAIACLQKIIKDRYVKNYPLLKKFAESKYTDKKKFDKEVKEALQEIYKCEFKDIDWRKVEQYTESGDMYLFQIFSKDFAKGSYGNRDIQTIYWESLFIPASPHQFCGGGKIFYRRQAVEKKKVKKGYENKPWVIEGRRFTTKEGKFLFHCPVKLNYRAPSQLEPKYAFPFVNKYINESFTKRSSLYFLGIDRGEKHLAYYSLIDSDGKIIEQGTLNMPFVDRDGEPRSTKAIRRFLDKNGKEKEEVVECWDYNDLLDVRAGDRDFARKNWQTIGTIRELKDGYVSQVVHKIVKLAVNIKRDKPTFVVLENLNTGFMRGRQKIEKSVYKKFETALVKKFNFLVDKSKDRRYEELGSVTKALQLTPPIMNYDELKERGGQAGIVLFVRPDYTSTTDPVTGWRKKVHIGRGSESSIRSKILESFDDIYFDGKDYVFVYIDAVTGRQWKMYSGKNGKGLDRYHRVRNEHGMWKYEKQNIPEILDKLFAGFDKKVSLKEQIKNGFELKKIDKHTAWESLRFVVNLIQQIRNTDGNDKGRDSDFILSPVRDDSDNHFDSRVYWDKEKNGEKVEWPTCGDANGAYNIARKGIITKEHIKRNFKLYIRDEEWDAWLAGNQVWKKWLEENIDLLKKATQWNPTSKSRK